MFSIALIILIHFFYYSFLIAIFLQIIYFFNYKENKENKENGRIKILHHRGAYVLAILIFLILIYLSLGGKISDLNLMGLEHW